MKLIERLRRKIMKNKINQNVEKAKIEKTEKIEKVETTIFIPKDRSDPLKFQDEINNELWLSGDGG